MATPNGLTNARFATKSGISRRGKIQVFYHSGTGLGGLAVAFGADARSVWWIYVHTFFNCTFWQLGKRREDFGVSPPRFLAFLKLVKGRSLGSTSIKCQRWIQVGTVAKLQPTTTPTDSNQRLLWPWTKRSARESSRPHNFGTAAAFQ